MKIEPTGGFIPFRIEIETKQDYDLLMSVLCAAESDIERKNFLLQSPIKIKGDVSFITKLYPEEREFINRLRRCGVK